MRLYITIQTHVVLLFASRSFDFAYDRENPIRTRQDGYELPIIKLPIFYADGNRLSIIFMRRHIEYRHIIFQRDKSNFIAVFSY